MSGDITLTILPETSRPLLDAARAVLATPGLPPVALIGGLAVTMRVAAAGIAHRATVDIDLVTDYAEPEAVEILAAAHHTQQHPLIVGNVEIDLIPTSAVTEDDLEGLDDHGRLFVAGHRWAFERSEPTRITTAGSTPVTVQVATPAGLVAAKSHALGFPNPVRRATKHGGDLLDFFRLVDIYDADGSLSLELRSGPAHLARIIAEVAQREVLANPAAAAAKMAAASPTPISTERVTDTVEAFVDELLR
ncbi:MAG: Prevent-host-death protein [Acidimicrobiales bacterium]|nr:Prevent-host-death protein [Acidimicrobiales bacterium]